MNDWKRKIESARKYDEAARKRYAIDRRYARGNRGGFQVSVPIAGSYIETLRAFLYARDPDLDISPSGAVSPPERSQIRELAIEQVMSADIGELRKVAADAEVDGPQAAEQAVRAYRENLVAEREKEILLPYQSKLLQAHQFARTMVLVIRHMWKRASLKRHAIDSVTSSLTVSIGWLKATWQESDDPMMAVDFIQAQDMQVAPGFSMSNYMDAPWIAHKAFIHRTKFNDIETESALMYAPERIMDKKSSTDPNADVGAVDANNFKLGSGDYLAVWEIWDKQNKKFMSYIEGMDGWLTPPTDPDPCVPRFYPFFAFTTAALDGSRHAQSLINRSEELLDEYNRTRSNFAEHRRRTIPKTAFDETLFDSQQIKKLEGAGTQEMVGIKPTRPGENIGNALHEVAYAPIDPSLYSTATIRYELEEVWHVEQALMGSVRPSITATEAEIKDKGTQTTLAYMRDSLDMMLQELAEYTAQVALCKIPHQKAVAIAGDWSFWPEQMDPEDIESLLSVKIKAASSGPPNQSRNRQIWMNTVPLLQGLILNVGKLRGSSPDAVANSLEALLEKTLQVNDENINPDRFLPGPPDPNAPANNTEGATAPVGAQPPPQGLSQPPKGGNPQVPSGPTTGDISPFVRK